MLAAGVLIISALAAVRTDSTDDLRRLFNSPPDDARIMMRWWWFGPAVTKAGLEREMRRMKEAGIGGFEVQPVYPVALDDPQQQFRNLPFLSAEFLDALRFTADTARELGLRFDLTLGSGWPYGGPTVPITEAAGRLRVERVKVPPGARQVALPDIGHGEALIAVFAGGTMEEVTDVRDGFARLKPGSTSDPDSTSDPGSTSKPGSTSEAGSTTAPGSTREVWFFIASRTGMMVKRPSVGAEGFVLDHYDRRALDRYLAAVADPMMRAVGPSRPYAVFCDSLEVFASDWTADILDEFRKRRGYDLRPHLPALVADVGPAAAAVRHDWGRTLTELLDDRFLSPMRDWSRANGTRFRIQGYGIPPATISSNALADLSEGEGSQWKIVRASRWASSANHLFGRPVTSSETWTWLHSPSFRATPLDLKAEADLHFLQGINQLIGHGWPYTPDGAAYPGWRFYAAGAFNDRNPWWIVMPDVARYLQRVSFLMRQGQPANDVALYLPNSDAWSRFVAGKVYYMIDALRERVGPDVIGRIVDAGYGLDFFDDGTLERLSAHHRIIVLPGVETMPVETARGLEKFVKAGGKVIATRRLPDRVPGFKATAADHAELKAILSRVVGQGPVTDENRLAGALHDALAPDVSLSPVGAEAGAKAAPTSEIGFVHRDAGDTQIYFLANTGNARREVKVSFRIANRVPELWDAMTGDSRLADVVDRGKDRVALSLSFEPYGSTVVVFVKDRTRPSGVTRVVPRTASTLDLSSGWRVSFGAGGQPEGWQHTQTMERLRSWTEDERTQFFSGTATYEKEVDVPAAMLKNGAVHLDFGEGTPVPETPRRNGMRAWLDAPVREAAVVYVNGERAGAVWCPPYALDVTRLLKVGPNRLKVLVGNLAINHMAGRPLPDYRLLNLRYGVRFEPQDLDRIQPLPSGLLGPVRLRTAKH